MKLYLKLLFSLFLINFFFGNLLNSASAAELVSLDNAGARIIAQNETPTISHNGQIICFESTLNDGADNFSGHHVYKKNLKTGELNLVSSSVSGAAGNAKSYYPSVSPDGRFVAFESIATNLTGNSGMQVYVKDTLTGKISIASVSQSGTTGNYFSNLPVVSSNGHLVYFQSNSSNLVPSGDRVYRIYEKNLTTGTVRTMATSSRGVEANGASMNVKIDASDAFIIFESAASNLVSGVSGYQIYRKKISNGDIQVVSHGNANSGQGSISKGGRYVAFVSSATNLITGVSGYQVYHKDLLTGEIRLVSADLEGEAGNNFSSHPVISQDGSSVAFISHSTNWPGLSGLPERPRIFKKNLLSGALTMIGSVDTEMSTLNIFGRFASDADLQSAAVSSRHGDTSSIYLVK